MKEIRDIVAAYDRAVIEGQSAALATVISVEGSSYRQAGARMLITEDGCMTGAISGGCLEGDALKKARLVMERNAPKLVRYDTTDEDDAQLGLGLGCRGIIEILIEPIDANAPLSSITLLRKAIEGRAHKVLVTHAATNGGTSLGTCLLVSDRIELRSCEEAGTFHSDAWFCVAEQASELRRIEDAVVFYQLLQPELRVLVCGAGNDAVPLTRLASVLGWESHVIDGRPNYATAARFPEAATLRIMKVTDRSADLETDARTVAVLMSHNYHYDLAMLERLVSSRLPYIGVLGPRRKLERMLLELGLDPERPPENVYGPTGLDIAASTPEEIALSIVAEIQAVIGRRSGASLRERRQPIHAG